MCSFSAHVMEQRKAFFVSLSPAVADRYSAASLSGRLGLDQHSCRGSRISPVFVSHSSVAWPLLFPLRSASTFQPQEQIQDSSGHEGTSSVVSLLPAFLYLPLSRPVGAALRLGPAGQTDRALCAGQSGQTYLPLSISPSCSVYIQEAGQPCWLHRLQCYGRSCLKFHPLSYSGFLRSNGDVLRLVFSESLCLIFAE